MHNEDYTAEQAYDENVAGPTMKALTRPVPPLSQSRQALMACPMLYEHRIIRGVREPENQYAARGTEIHRALATYVTHLVTTRQPADFEFFRSLCDSLSEDAFEVLDGFRESLALDPEKVLGTEIYLALDEELSPLHFTEDRSDWSGGGDPAYEGTLDYVQLLTATEAEIFDWKSYYQIVDADTFQAKLYPLLLFTHYPQLERVRFHLQFVRYGATRSVEYTRADAPKLEALARRERARQLRLHQDEGEGTIPAAMPGAHCLYCAKLTTTCPIREQNPHAIMAPEERLRFGLWLAAAKKQNDQVLKEHVNIAGPVRAADGNGKTYEAGFQLVERTSYPAKVLPIVSVNDPDLVSKLTISGLSSPLKAAKRKALRDLLDPQKITTAITRFGITGADDEEE